MRIVVVGSGFAGSILARVLHRQGHTLTLLEKDRHPRFAVGESATPLAAIALERIAYRYGLSDLHALAAYGRWRAQLPRLRRGLKRGFTFYAHRTGRPYVNDDANSARLLVAASPDDAVADAHWLREDVDAFLAGRAEAEGIAFLDRTDVQFVERSGEVWQVGIRRVGDTVRRIHADLLIDASGAANALARHLDIEADPTPVPLATGAIFGHFKGVRALAAAAPEAALPSGPYPDERAAVHHLLAEGWMYQLPFDHGVVSAGIVIEHGDFWRLVAARPPADAFQDVLARYPTLAAQFAGATPVQPPVTIPRLQRRLRRAAGSGWALLPHTYAFWSPLFSTGIAWSLVAIERLALALEQPPPVRVRALARYDDVVRAEAEHLLALTTGAYHLRPDFDRFVAHSMIYFAAASYLEAAQRLLDHPPSGGAWAWEGFLGADDPVIRRAVTEGLRLAADEQLTGGEHLRRVRELIAPRNVAGLADPHRNRLYPVDFEPLRAGAALLGMSPEEMEAALPRLRSSS